MEIDMLIRQNFAYEQSGNYAEAIAGWHRLIRLSPNSMLMEKASVKLAFLYKAVGCEEAAWSYARLAIAYPTQSPSTHLLRADFLSYLGLWGDAHEQRRLAEKKMKQMTLRRWADILDYMQVEKNNLSISMILSFLLLYKEGINLSLLDLDNLDYEEKLEFFGPEGSLFKIYGLGEEIDLDFGKEIYFIKEILQIIFKDPNIGKLLRNEDELNRLLNAPIQEQKFYLKDLEEKIVQILSTEGFA